MKMINLVYEGFLGFCSYFTPAVVRTYEENRKHQFELESERNRTSSKKTYQFKTRVQKAYPIYDQNAKTDTLYLK